MTVTGRRRKNIDLRKIIEILMAVAEEQKRSSSKPRTKPKS